MCRVFVALMLLAGFGCQDRGASDLAAPKESVKVAPAGDPGKQTRKAPIAEVPKKSVEDAVKTPCESMFQLLRKCNKGSRAFRDSRFRANFIRGCEEERGRPTKYAQMFAKCAVSESCEELKKCSEEMRQQATDLGPEHVDYLLLNAQRDAAMKFCDDHRQLLSRNVKLERRCTPLLGLLDKQRSEHEHDGSCNH